MLNDFIPLNELERRLVAAQEGQIPPESFARILAGSQVFMPILEEQARAQDRPRAIAEPLKIPGDDGGEVLVLFTSPERAKGFVADYPGYDSGLVTELSWILETLGVGYTISLNPGDSLGLDFEARDMARIAADTRPR